jgi:hypothetical protein
MTVPLSPAAQAVLDAVAAALERGYSGPAAYDIAAAALRAAADQVVPDKPGIPEGDLTEQAYRHDERYGIRTAFLSLATELDPTP